VKRIALTLLGAIVVPAMFVAVGAPLLMVGIALIVMGTLILDALVDERAATRAQHLSGRQLVLDAGARPVGGFGDQAYESHPEDFVG
jgi:hypothetical protein